MCLKDKLILRGVAMIIRLLLRVPQDNGMDAVMLAEEMEREAREVYK